MKLALFLSAAAALYFYLSAESYEQRLLRHDHQERRNKAWALDYGHRVAPISRCIQ